MPTARKAMFNSVLRAVLFHGVVSFEWPAYLSGSEAIGGFLTYDLTKNSLSQIVVAVFVFCRLLHLLCRKTQAVGCRFSACLCCDSAICVVCCRDLKAPASRVLVYRYI